MVARSAGELGESAADQDDGQRALHRPVDGGDEGRHLLLAEHLHLVDHQQYTQIHLTGRLTDGLEQVDEVVDQDAGVGNAAQGIDIE